MRTLLYFLTLLIFLTGCGITQEQLDSSVARLDKKIERLNSTLEEDRYQNQVLLQRMRDSVRFYQNLMTELERQNVLLGYDSVDFRKLGSLLQDYQQIENANQTLRTERKTRNDSLMLQKAFIRDLLHSPSPTYSAEVRMFNNSFHAYIVNLEQTNLQLFWKNGQGKKYKSLENLRLDIEQGPRKLLFAINAGMYTPSQDPQGLYIEHGRQLRPIDLQKDLYGNFYLKPNGVFLIDQQGSASVVLSEQFADFSKNTLFATQSGPMLVIDGKIHPKFTLGSKNKYIRSGVGIINPKKVVFIISNEPVNFYDFASLFRDYFGCQNALYLDGAISQMYLPELGRKELGGNFGPLIGIVR